MSDEAYTHRILQRLDALVARYERSADNTDTATRVTNLTGIHRLLTDLVGAQQRELDAWAIDCRNAEAERDELLVRVQELEAELTEAYHEAAQLLDRLNGAGTR